MAEFGLALLGVVALLVATTGVPVFVVLLVASCVGAAVGVASGAIPLALLGALPSRLIGLLENDLLQAVPLFVFIGALLDRLPLADLLYRGGCRLAGRGGASPRLAAMGLSALLAPMNGSVGASVAMLARVVAPRLRARGVDPAQTTALVSVASTLGVLVPPSIVLLLLGDAMMSAHTQALRITGAQTRIINTQDLLHGVLGPAAIVLLLIALIAAWQARRALSAAPAWLGRGEAAVAVLTVVVIGTLLGGVAAGWFHAVEAAACGSVLLFIGGVLSGRLGFAPLSGALHDALDITGSLCALFVSATTFTLLLRTLGADVLVAAAFGRLPGGPTATVAASLAVLLLCGLVLDAYELIFVVVPILMPPVLVRVDDALWVAVLSLLALQMSFLLPPLGYAVMMSGARITPHPTMRQLVWALAPYLYGLACVLGLVLAYPRLVHLLDEPAAAAASTLSPDEVERLMRSAPSRNEP
jgi:tripartite ATP-independent transporter DctM subunit